MPRSLPAAASVLSYIVDVVLEVVSTRRMQNYTSATYRALGKERKAAENRRLQLSTPFARAWSSGAYEDTCDRLRRSRLRFPLRIHYLRPPHCCVPQCVLPPRPWMSSASRTAVSMRWTVAI